MTMIQEQAIDMIKRMPDDKIVYVIGILKGIEGLFIRNETENLSVSQNAYRNLQKFRKKGSGDTDYKAELAETLEEKYESIG